MNDRISELKAMVGENIKVFLPGESPWAEVLEVDVNDSIRVRAKILNKLFHENSEHEQARFMKGNFGSVEPLPKLHDYKQNDELWFRYGKYGFEPETDGSSDNDD